MHSPDETLSPTEPPTEARALVPSPNPRTWAMILHMSTLAGVIIPLAGVFAPIVIWRIKRSELPELDPHGRAAANWILSATIYGLVAIALCTVFVGFLLLPVLCVLWVVLPIIAGVKAHEGVEWRYPLAIPFFR